MVKSRCVGNKRKPSWGQRDALESRHGSFQIPQVQEFAAKPQDIHTWLPRTLLRPKKVCRAPAGIQKVKALMREKTSNPLWMLFVSFKPKALYSVNCLLSMRALRAFPGIQVLDTLKKLKRLLEEVYIKIKHQQKTSRWCQRLKQQEWLRKAQCY